MVGAATLALDVLETSVYFAAPALLWLFLFSLAYREPELAVVGGFDRKTFWLLVPSALLAEFANILFFGFGTDLLAVNVGGGLIPIVLSVWLLARTFPQPRRSVAELLAVGAIATGAALAAVELDLPGLAGRIVPGILAAAPGVVFVAYALRVRDVDRARVRLVASVALLFGLTVLVTQLTTSAIPGLGIVSVFPEYLLAPIGLGALAALVVRRTVRGSYGPALAIAYASATLGVLVGADVLHQPPLYGGGGGALYAIGGAGILDLLHLSGLLALLGAYVVVLLLRRPRPAPAAEDPSPVSASRLVRRSWYRYLAGDAAGAVRDAQVAAARGVADARRLHQLPPSSPRGAWDGLPSVPPWVPIDHANLAAIAARPDPGPREAYRSWLTARALVTLSSALGHRRRATASERARAFGFDLAVLFLGFVAVDVALFASVTGSFGAFLNGLLFNGAMNGAIGWGLAYFLVFETYTGTTPGKRLLGLAVRTPDGRPPGIREVFLRNLPRIVLISVLAYGTGVAVLVLLHPALVGGSVGVANYLAEVIIVGLGGFVLSGLLSILTIAATDERQRLGDLVAGTWVVRELPIRRVRAPAPAGARPGAGSSPPAAA